MKSLVLIIGLLMVGGNVLAKNTNLSCVGMDGTGQMLHVVTDDASLKIIINGEIHKINGTTKKGKGLITENLISSQGVYIFNIFWLPNNGESSLAQYNAVTGKLLRSFDLACHII